MIAWKAGSIDAGVRQLIEWLMAQQLITSIVRRSVLCKRREGSLWT